MINLGKMEILQVPKLIKNIKVGPGINSIPLTKRTILVFTITLLMSKIATRITEALEIKVGSMTASVKTI